MTDDPKRDQNPPDAGDGDGSHHVALRGDDLPPDRVAGPEQSAHEDVPQTASSRPERPRGFSISQHDLIVPKPKYHDHLEDLDDPSDASATGEETSGQATEHYPAAVRSNRARKQRIWMFLVFLMFIYAVFRTMRFMH